MAYLPAQYFVDPQRFLLLSIYRLAALKSWPAVERRQTVTATSIDLDAYLQRIHWSGDRDPTLDTLAGLIQAHTAHIPFEKLDILLGRTVCLDLDGLQAKIVGARRGGYCFEHATLFAAVLDLSVACVGRILTGFCL
jgi:hypothetical protein